MADQLRRSKVPTEKQGSSTDLAEIGAEGGRRRAARLTPEERSEAARVAAEARWGRTVTPATHEGELIIGKANLECAVLDDGQRVISQGTLLRALGRAPSMGRRNTTPNRPP